MAIRMNHATNAAFLEFAVRTAEAAGAAILPHFRVALDVADKGGAAGYDPVTVADHAAESVIRGAIARAYPDHGIRGEEHGWQKGAANYTWVEQQGRSYEELVAQWDPEYWQGIWAEVGEVDRLIEDFNARVAR